jgi:hypothetical protein
MVHMVHFGRGGTFMLRVIHILVTFMVLPNLMVRLRELSV